MPDFNTVAYVVGVFEGSDGQETMTLYQRLEAIGPAGAVAMNVFRALKNSQRAKVYRGGNGKGSYKSQAYDRKQWAMGNLTKILGEQAEALGMGWGWGVDVNEPAYPAVLYIDLPTGQVSFHTEARGEGPDYPSVWDGKRGLSTQRVCRWVAELLSNANTAEEANV